jgi:cell division protein FtsX
MTPLERAWRGTRNDWRLHLLGVFSVAVAFVCLASALLVVVNIDAIRARWSESGRASIYLRPSATPEQIRSIESALQATSGVTSVRFVSSDDARREVLNGEGDDVLAKLPSEAFPASLEVRVEDEAGADRVAKLETQLEALPAVEAVETYHAWSERLNRCSPAAQSRDRAGAGRARRGRQRRVLRSAHASTPASVEVQAGRRATDTFGSFVIGSRTGRPGRSWRCSCSV